MQRRYRYPGVMTITVGVIANPASGRDIRRLVSSASVFDNAEKANMVVRLMAGLVAAGVDRVLMMPTAGSIMANLNRRLRTAASHGDRLKFLDMPVEETAVDTVRATTLLCAAGVRGIAVLGGDGTHRLVARDCGDVPLLALSTGTNNAFPELREATVAGLALGLAATGQVAASAAHRRNSALAVSRDADRWHGYALVDFGVSADRFAGARAVWRPDEVREIFVAFAEPSAMGLSAVAGLLQPEPRGGELGVHVVLAPVDEARIVVTVPFAPGQVSPVGVRSYAPLRRGQEVAMAAGTGAIVLDGEREIERTAKDRFTVRLVDGPLTVDVARVLHVAAANGLLRTVQAYPTAGACPPNWSRSWPGSRP
jgi:predicted polyphosphate/ATP-dependent NAD kinase